MVEIWNQPGWPPESMPAPAGFTVTPAEAYVAVADSKRLSLKHAWFCFRDESDYYIAEAFGRTANAANARRHGIRVNGQSAALR